MKKSELKRQIDELQLQVERLNERISNLEAEPKVYPPTVYPPRVYRSDNPLCPEQRGWNTAHTETPATKYQTGLSTRPADTGTTSPCRSRNIASGG